MHTGSLIVSVYPTRAHVNSQMAYQLERPTAKFIPFNTKLFSTLASVLFPREWRGMSLISGRETMATINLKSRYECV